MYKIRKLRCYPNKTQQKRIETIFRGCGFCRREYNKYIRRVDLEHNMKYAKLQTLIKEVNPKFKWLNEERVPVDAIKDILRQEYIKWRDYPGIKYGKQPAIPSEDSVTSYYFGKASINFEKYDNKYLISVPILGKLRISEPKYLPDIESVTSGYISREGDKYYILFRYIADEIKTEKADFSCVCKLGVNNLATIAYSNGDVKVVPHFNTNENYIKANRKIERFREIIDKKCSVNYNKGVVGYQMKHGKDPDKKECDEIWKKACKKKSIQKICDRRRKLQRKKDNIEKYHLYQLVNDLVVHKEELDDGAVVTRVPKYITIETINKNIPDFKKSKIFGNVSYRHKFEDILVKKCKEYSCEIRYHNMNTLLLHRCNVCGHIVNDIYFSNNMFTCSKCGFECDADKNIALNMIE